MKIIFKYLSVLDRQNKKKFWILVSLITLSLILEVLSLGSLIPFFKIIISEDQNNLFYKTFETLNIQKENLVFLSIILLGLIFFLKTVFITFIIYFKHNFIYELSSGLSKNILINYENSPIYKNLTTNNADVQRLILIDVSMTSSGVLQLCNGFSEIIVVISSLIILLYLEPLIIIFFICLSLIIFILYKNFYKSKIIKWGEERKKYDTLRRSQIVDFINTLVFSKLIKIKNNILNLYVNSNRSTNYYYQLRERWNEIPRALLELFAIIFILILFSYFSFQKFELESIFPVLSIFTLASLKIIISINRLLVSFNQILFCLPALNRVLIDLNRKFKKNISSIKRKKNTVKNITFDNVSFQYGKKLLFKNLNLKFSNKDFIGIYGPSGSGKSTLLSLIMGVIHPTQGSIKINNKNINKFNLRIGYVGQNINLIQDSVLNNIAFGVSNKRSINIAKINKILKELGLDGFVNSLPDKLNTEILEKSSNISVGQAQRIVIARALYFEPDILVLDEPTSSLDIKNENDVIKILNIFSKKKTIFLVSHKMNNLKYCNKIISIKNNSLTIKNRP